MEKKNALWVVAIWDNESARLTSKRGFKTKQEAKDEVYVWFVEAKTDENCEASQIDDDELFACANINGREEYCEAFEVEI